MKGVRLVKRQGSVIKEMEPCNFLVSSVVYLSRKRKTGFPHITPNYSTTNINVKLEEPAFREIFMFYNQKTTLGR